MGLKTTQSALKSNCAPILVPVTFSFQLPEASRKRVGFVDIVCIFVSSTFSVAAEA
jgi:hypothetical protein